MGGGWLDNGQQKGKASYEKANKDGERVERALQTIFHFCIPKKDLAKPDFLYQLSIS